MNTRRLLLAAILCVSIVPPAASQVTTTAAAAAQASATTAFSADRLKRLDAVMEQYVADRKVPGVVVYLAKDGRVAHLKSYGFADVEGGTKLSDTHLFRLASMSKAITTVAAMILQEEGALTIADPVSKYLPSFKQTYVMVPPAPGTAASVPLGTVPAKRPITIRDLMTHTAGLSYGDGALEAKYKAANAFMWYCADHDETIGEMVDRLATLPFAAQPGERYVYGFGTDVLGRVVEVAAGMPLDEFLRRRIFEPLKMPDSYFFVPPEKASRLATVYGIGPAGTIVRAPAAGRAGQGEYVDGPRKCFAGGAGLVSTITDYGRFLQMLLNGGQLDGARLLSPASVASMTSNHVGTLYQDGAYGFGLGFEVVEHVGRAGRLGAAGEFSWGSAYYSRYFVDPRDGVVAIMMTQLIPAGTVDLNAKFRSLVYQALVDEVPAAPAGTRPKR